MYIVAYLGCRSRWPRGQRPRYAAPRLLRLWFRIPPGAWTFVCRECCLCCQAEVCATSWSLVQRSPTDCGASFCVIIKFVNEEALAHWGLSRQKQTNKRSGWLWTFLIASFADQRLCNVAVNVFTGWGKSSCASVEVECNLEWISLWMSCTYGFSKCWKWSVWMGLSCFQHSAAPVLQRCTGTLPSLCTRIWCVTVWGMWKQAWARGVYVLTVLMMKISFFCRIKPYRLVNRCSMIIQY